MLHREHGAPYSRGSARLRISQPVTATTDFLAPDILNKCGRAFPALWGPLHSTLASVAEADGPRQPSRASRRHRDTVRAINDGVSAFGAKADIPPQGRNFRVWVESRCGAVALGRTYLLPPLSFGGALMVRP
jgi:hypothetical protein